jgi:electron transport complex protein RnfC
LFEEIALEQGKTVTGIAKVDFLCNEPLTLKSMKGLVPEGTKNVFVISCGLGIQTMAELCDLPVYTASDTIAVSGSMEWHLHNPCEAEDNVI